MAQARDALSDRAWDNELARDALTDVERSGASPPLSGVDATVSELRVRGGPFENPPVG